MGDGRKTVLITGCSPGGIGHSLALEFRNKGARVFATARSANTLSDLAAKDIETLSLEVDRSDSIATCVDEIKKRTGGKLDYLVNNAGRNYTVPALDIDMEEVWQTFEVNVFAVIAMCQAFAPLLIEAKGTIVQIGSVAGVMPYVFGSVYNASKAALHSYSNTLRVELAPFDVSVVTIVTGGVTSRIARTHRTLPKDSYYVPIEDEYERRLTHSQSTGSTMPNETYAKSVVEQVWASGQRRLSIWAGARAWQIWAMTTFFPLRLQNLIFSNMFKVWKLNPAYGGAASKSK